MGRSQVQRGKRATERERDRKKEGEREGGRGEAGYAALLVSFSVSILYIQLAPTWLPAAIGSLTRPDSA